MREASPLLGPPLGGGMIKFSYAGRSALRFCAANGRASAGAPIA